jgi:hypothetical protein
MKRMTVFHVRTMKSNERMFPSEIPLEQTSSWQPWDLVEKPLPRCSYDCTAWRPRLSNRSKPHPLHSALISTWTNNARRKSPLKKWIRWHIMRGTTRINRSRTSLGDMTSPKQTTHLFSWRSQLGPFDISLHTCFRLTSDDGMCASLLFSSLSLRQGCWRHAGYPTYFLQGRRHVYAMFDRDRQEYRQLTCLIPISYEK